MPFVNPPKQFGAVPIDVEPPEAGLLAEPMARKAGFFVICIDYTSILFAAPREDDAGDWRNRIGRSEVLEVPGLAVASQGQMWH